MASNHHLSSSRSVGSVDGLASGSQVDPPIQYTPEMRETVRAIKRAAQLARKLGLVYVPTTLPTIHAEPYRQPERDEWERSG